MFPYGGECFVHLSVATGITVSCQKQQLFLEYTAAGQITHILQIHYRLSAVMY